MTTAMNKPLPPDWERIELDYRAGLLSLREIASAQGITHAAVRKRALRDGWDRNLAARIAAKAEALVSKALVSTQVSKQRLVTERDTIEAGAQRVAKVRNEHRADISRVRALGKLLLTELEAQCADPEALAQLGELMRDPAANGGKLDALYQRIISTPSRVDSAKKMVETIRNGILMEREAYGLDEPATAPEQPPLGRSAHVIFNDFEATAEALRLKFERKIAEWNAEKAALAAPPLQIIEQQRGNR